MRVVTLLALFLMSERGWAQEAMPAQTVQKLKQATVFLRVKAGGAAWGGTGFLIHREADTGYIITTAQVAPALPEAGQQAPAIEAVFFSSTRAEVSCKAELLATLSEEDLALLRVKDFKGLPAAFNVSAASAPLSETMAVYCLSFPFRKLLGSGEPNPGPTVSEGSVSSLRHNRQGELVAVQLDGVSGRGYGGGPVVDREGSLVGVLTSFKGVPIPMAVPAAEVARIMNGRPTDTRVQITKAGVGAGIAVEVTLADPLGRVRAVTAYYFPEEAAKEKTLIGQTKPLTGAAKIELTVQQQKAAGSLPWPENKKASYWLQIGYTGADAKERFLGAMALRLDARGRPRLVQYQIPDNLDHLKKNNLAVHFTLADPERRQKVVEEIKQRVGNPLNVQTTLTAGSQVTVELFPVNDPRGFLERLEEIGRITRIYGPNILFDPQPFSGDRQKKE